MKKLDRYLVSELMVPFLIGTLAVVMMFQANTLIAIFKDLSLQHVPPLAILQLILYKTPSFLVMTLPVGTALAASLAMSRIARDSELTAMRVAGASILRTIWPVAFFGLAVAGLNYYVAEDLTPRAEKLANDVQRKVLAVSGIPTFLSNATVKLRTFTVSIGTVTRSGEMSMDLRDILMIERPRPGETTMIVARAGDYRNGIWTVRGAYVYQFKDDNLIVAKPRKEVTINEQLILDDFFGPPTPDQLTGKELLAAIENAKKAAMRTANLEVAYHVRFSVPASCFIFAFVSPIFAIYFARSGGFVGVLLSIFMVLIYYNVYVISTEIFGRNEWLPPVFAAWLPNVLFGVLGAIGIWRLE